MATETLNQPAPVATEQPTPSRLSLPHMTHETHSELVNLVDRVKLVAFAVEARRVLLEYEEARSVLPPDSPIEAYFRDVVHAVQEWKTFEQSIGNALTVAVFELDRIADELDNSTVRPIEPRAQ